MAEPEDEVPAVNADDAAVSETATPAPSAAAPQAGGLNPRIKKLLMILLPFMVITTGGAFYFSNKMMQQRQQAMQQAVQKPAQADAVIAMLADTPTVAGDTSVARNMAHSETRMVTSTSDTKNPPPVDSAPVKPAPKAATTEKPKPPVASSIAAAAPESPSKDTVPAAIMKKPRTNSPKPPSFVVMRAGEEVLHDFTRAPVE